MSLGFRIIRLIENRLIASDCLLETTIDVRPRKQGSRAKERIKAMRLWIDEFVDGSVAISVGQGIDTSTIEQVSNNVLMCPDDPHDYLLLLLLHSKLSAIGEDEVIVGSTKLVSDQGEGFTNHVEGTVEDWLPSMAEWIGPRHFHDHPWWARPDSSTMDLKPEDGDDLSDLPELGYDLLAMVSVAQKTEAVAPELQERTAEIIKPVFKPRVIPGSDD